MNAKVIGEILYPIVIGQETCDACNRMKKLLDDAGVPYAYVDYDTMPRLLQKEIVRTRKMNHIGQIGIPLWIFNGVLYQGYDPELIDRVILQPFSALQNMFAELAQTQSVLATAGAST